MTFSAPQCLQVRKDKFWKFCGSEGLSSFQLVSLTLFELSQSEDRSHVVWQLLVRSVGAYSGNHALFDTIVNNAAEQKYGPLTSKRRQKAYLERKQLKESGVIASGYVDFPAKLMVNLPGDVDRENKKIYKLHTNFSRYPVD